MSACPNCRTSASHGNTIGCCTACGRCFSGLLAFEAHQIGPRDERGRLTCQDPETAKHPSGRTLFVPSSKSRAGEPTIWRQWSDPTAGKWWEAAS